MSLEDYESCAKRLVNKKIAISVLTLCCIIGTNSVVKADEITQSTYTPILTTLNQSDDTYPESAYSLTPSETGSITIDNTSYDLNLTINSDSLERIINKSADYGNVNGNFRDISLTGGDIYGGAIYNSNSSSTIGNIVGHFVGNSLNNTKNFSDTFGGAIYNYGTIKDITGDFVGNSNTNTGKWSRAYGGAIINNDPSASIGNITGDFINNYTKSSTESAGGAIFNNCGSITSITGNFINNKTLGSADTSYGGAIVNYYGGRIGTITGDFINNTSEGDGYSMGGAIYSYYKATIDNINGNFVNNSAKSDYSASGGAIYSESGIFGDIIGNFVGNTANGTSYAEGGAVFNYKGYFDNITGDFVNNSTSSEYKSFGGAIYNDSGNIGDVVGDFVGNTANGTSYAEGGAVFNYKGYVDNITGDFVNNSASSEYKSFGGAIYNDSGNIGDVVGDFVGNSANGTSYAEGGAIDNYNGTIGSTDENGNVVGGLINSSLLSNYAKSDEGSAYGGAIYTNTDLNLIADNKTVEISGNYTDSAGKMDDNAIYVDEATLTFKLDNSAKILMKDNVRGADYRVNIVGDSLEDTTFYMLNDMYNANLAVANTTINTVDNKTHVYNVNSLTLNDNVNMIADVDLANEEMDRFTANSYGEHKGTISVTGMNLISDMPEDKDMTSIMFAQVGLKDNVVDYLSSVPNDKYQNFEYYTPIYKYNVAYDNRQDAGYYVFTRGDKYYKSNDANLGEEWTAASGVGASTGTIESTGNPSDAFNPAVLSAPVSAQASAQMILSQAYIYSFRHADAYTLLPNSDRMAELNRNKYAFASTDFDGNISYDAGELLNKGIWFKPYTSFDTMSLKNGPKVHSVNYGSMVGFDTNFKELKHGWIAVGTGYLGYNGSQLRYSNTDVSTNGGLLGYTGSFYRGNFWTAVTVSAGASVGESRNMYGKDDFTTLIAGLASKTGYNFEFKEGKYIFQPSLIMSYSFIDTFDYTNAAGVKIDADPMHSVQINPNLKFIVNMKHCLHPYASVGMVWDVFNSSHVKANGITLPEMSIKPYVEYGVGIQKHWKDNYSAFGQVMLRNGGRTGVALSCGFRWAIGKDKVQKVNRPYQNVRVSSGVDAGNKKIIKQIKLI